MALETAEREERGTKERPRVRASTQLASDGSVLQLTPVSAPFFPYWREEGKGMRDEQATQYKSL